MFKCAACGDPSVEAPGAVCSPECAREAVDAGVELGETIAMPEWQREFMAERRFESAEVPPIHAGGWSDAISDQAPALREIAEGFARKFETNATGLFLGGPAGVGKSRLAAQIVREVCGIGKACRWYCAPVLFARLRSTMNERSEETEVEILAEMSKIPLIVIDDLGVERCSEWVLERLYMIVNDRIEKRRKMVITSNLELSELKKYWSKDARCAAIADRLVSRIDGACYSVTKFGSEDLRRKHR